ncbi:hypothetical protein [Streptomyces sp. NPDC058086]|uniref:hypothetical protein n=1 Tax=Streptomyces sp. NPDC058086 TaxID=3346334 RepID=UPI0036EEF070
MEPNAVGRRGRLVAAAESVLADLAEQLGDTGFLVLLAEREARITDVQGPVSWSVSRR